MKKDAFTAVRTFFQRSTNPKKTSLILLWERRRHIQRRTSPCCRSEPTINHQLLLTGKVGNVEEAVIAALDIEHALVFADSIEGTNV